MKKPLISILDIVIIGLFISLFFISSNIIPPFFLVPNVPITIQVLVILMAGSFLGLKRGLLFIFALFLFTIAGIPLMSKYGSGVAALLNPATGGFIWGFILIIAVMGIYKDFISKYFKKFYIAGYIIFGIIAVVLDYLCGTGWIVYNTSKAFLPVFVSLFIFFPFDIAKVVIASVIDERLKKYFKY